MTDTSAQAADIAASWLRTDALAYYATHWYKYTNGGNLNGFVWDAIDSTQEGAIAYYAELAERDDDGEYLREEAAAALAAGGWTRKAIAFKLS